MLTLPYQCQPYPDEIVGSWFSRLSLHNGSGAWSALTFACGYPILKKPMFDLLDHDERLELLLKALGISYEHMLLELTTLPYWMAFDQMREKKILAGTETLHFIVTASLPKASGQQISFSRFNTPQNQALQQPKYCPYCLEADYQTVGEPYWHRTHQLRNLFFCPIHRCSLMTSCSKCQKTMATLKKRLINLPYLKCSCGNDLTISFKSSPPDDFWVRLGDISVQALKCKRPLWYHDQVREVLKSKLEINSRKAQGGYDDVLMNIFGFQERKSEIQSVIVPGHPDRPSMQLRRRWTKIGAPECCAIMAMMALNFENLLKEFEVAPTILKKHRKFITTVEQARTAMENWIKRHHLVHPSRFPSGYWFLLINDPAWIKEKFPNVQFPLLKSTESDRKDFSIILKRTDIPPEHAMRAAISSGTAVRLRYRDAAWMQQELTEFRKLQKRKIRAKVDISDKVRDIELSIKDLVQAEGPPVRITNHLLASKFTLSEAQVARIINNHPHLKEEIKIANLDRARRSLRWAAQCMLNEGRRLNIKELIRRGGTTKYCLMKPIAEKIIAEMQPN